LPISAGPRPRCGAASTASCTRSRRSRTDAVPGAGGPRESPAPVGGRWRASRRYAHVERAYATTVGRAPGTGPGRRRLTNTPAELVHEPYAAGAHPPRGRRARVHHRVRLAVRPGGTARGGAARDA